MPAPAPPPDVVPYATEATDRGVTWRVETDGTYDIHVRPVPFRKVFPPGLMAMAGVGAAAPLIGLAFWWSRDGQWWTLWLFPFIVTLIVAVVAVTFVLLLDRSRLRMNFRAGPGGLAVWCGGGALDPRRWNWPRGELLEVSSEYQNVQGAEGRQNFYCLVVRLKDTRRRELHEDNNRELFFADQTTARSHGVVEEVAALLRRGLKLEDVAEPAAAN